MSDKVEMDDLECLKDRLIVSERIGTINEPIDIILSLIGLANPAAEGIKVLKDIVVNKFDSFQNEKRNKFCEVVLENKVMITSDKVRDITFIMEFLRTMDVVNRISQNDKVIYIARLFKKSFVVRDISEFDVDQYEEFLHRLDFLSLKEIDLLVDFSNYCKIHNNKDHDEWYTFKTMISKKMSITEDEVVSIFSGLCMTGFCRQSNVLFPSDGDIENPFIITDYFKRFVEMIIE